MLNLFLEKFALRKKENVLMKRNVIEFLGFCLSLLPTRNFRLNLDFYLFLSQSFFGKFTILTFIFSFLKLFIGKFTPPKKENARIRKGVTEFQESDFVCRPS